MRLTLAPCDPCFSLHSPQVALLLRGIRHSQAKSGPWLIRLPITPTLMRCIKSTLARHADSYDSILLWAASCIVFFGFFRCREFLQLVPDSSTIHPDQPVQRHSFTAQFQQALSASGVDGSLFNGHRFCLSTATSASITGVSQSIIKLLGRWQSSAYPQYIWTPPSDLTHISQQLVPSDSSTNP